MTILRKDVSPRDVCVGDILFIEFEYNINTSKIYNAKVVGKFLCWEYIGEYKKTEFLQVETRDDVLSMFGLKDDNLFAELTRFNINRDSIRTLQTISENELILYKLLTEGD